MGSQSTPSFDSPYSDPKLQLIDRFIDEPRSLKVAIVGAGLAGISAGILLPAKVPGIRLTIYEKNGDMVSYFRNYKSFKLTRPRAAPGMKMCILASDVTFPLMYINRRSIRIHSGRRFSPRAKKFVTTGKD